MNIKVAAFTVMPRSHIHGFDAGLATDTILHHPWQSVLVRIFPCCIRNHTQWYLHCASVSDYGNCHFRGHPWDLIRSGTGEVIRECVTWA